MIEIHDSMRKVVCRSLILLMAGGVLAAGNLADASGQRQILPRPGEWRVLLEDSRPGAPVSLSMGLVGGRYVSEWDQRTQRREPDNLRRTQIPTLVLQCVQGATEIFIDNSVMSRDRQNPRDSESAFRRSQREPLRDQFILLVLDNKETIELRPWSPAPTTQRLYLPAPFDLLRTLMGHEMLWVYWTLAGGYPPSAELHPQGAVPPPDVVFDLRGLRDLLRETQDPCEWLL